MKQVIKIAEKDWEEERKKAKRGRKAALLDLKAAKPDRSPLPPPRIRILILMSLPIHPPSVFPLRRFEHEKLKKGKFQELRITVWPGATQQTPTMTGSVFKASGSCFHQGILVFFYSATPPANAICLFLKSELQDSLPAYAVFLCAFHNQTHAGFCCSAACWLLFTAKPRSVAQC